MKYIGVICIGLWLVLAAHAPLYAQSRDARLGQAVNAINRGDFDQADREFQYVQYWGCEEDHAYRVKSMQRAYDYLQHCTSSALPQRTKDSIALYLVEECGMVVNETAAKGDNDRTADLCRIGLRMCEMTWMKHHYDYAVLLLDISLYYQQSGQVDKALEYGLQALQVYKGNRLTKNDNYVTTVFLTGGYYSMLGDKVAAYPYIREAYDLSISPSGKKHPHYDSILRTMAKLEGHMGVYYSDKGNYKEAQKHYQEALQLQELWTGKQDPQYAVILNNLANAYTDNGEFEQALRYHRQSMDLRRTVYGEKHDEYAAALVNISTTYIEMGEVDKAERALLQAKQIMDHNGKKAPSYSTLLQNLGTVYEMKGDMRQAERYFTSALKGGKQSTGTDSPDYALKLLSIGAMSQQTGDFQKAKQYYLQARDIQKRHLGENHPEYATTLANLGTVYLDMKDFDRAEQYLLQSLHIRQNVLGKNHLDCASSLNNLALVYDKRGEDRKAIKTLIDAWEIMRKAYGDNNPHTALALNNIGGMCEKIEDYTTAELYYRKAYDIVRVIYHERNPLYLAALSNLGNIYYEMGDYRRAEPYLLKCNSIRKQQFVQSMGFMTESEREKYWAEHMLPEFEFIIPNLTYDYYRQEPRYAGIAYDNQLFYKGALFQSAEAVKRSIQESGNPTLISQWNELNDLRKQIVKLQESDPKSEQLNEYEQRAEQLEKTLTQSSAVYRENQQHWNTKWQDVQRALQTKEVAIEFASILRHTGEVQYCALVLRKEDTYPQLIPLFEERELKDILRTQTPDELYDYAKSGWRLSTAIWTKILPCLHYGDTVYCAATGVLHQIAIETLPLSETQSIQSMFHIVRVSSTRELAMRHGVPQHTSAALYGGIYYDMDMDDLLAQSESYSTRGMVASRYAVDKPMRDGFSYLQGTKREVEQIDAIMQPTSVKVTVYSGGTANEESFKALSGQHTSILHIATHGFYWTDETAREQRYFTQRSASMRNQDLPIDPLNRSGLLFAGANIVLRGHSAELPENVQDGILTAKEISLLDLRGADIVVLSACETGKGEITGDGVFGLQRAFKMAGAQTILMSLWSVDDAATQLMMTAFYRYWIMQHMNKREAFLHAQTEVKQRYPQPSYWAAFILLD